MGGEAAVKRREEKDYVFENVKRAVVAIEGIMDDKGRQANFGKTMFVLVRIQNSGRIEELLRAGQFQEAHKEFENAVARLTESERTRQEMRGAFEKEKADIAWERQADALGDRMLAKKMFEHFKTHAEDAQRFYARAGDRADALRSFMEYAYENADDKELYRIASQKKFVSEAIGVLKASNSPEGVRLAKALETAFKANENGFAVTGKMAEEYLKGNYATVTALDAAASKSMDSAYAIANDQKMLMLSAMLIQQRQNVYNQAFAGLTLVFSGVGYGVKEEKVAAGEPEGEAKAKMEAREAEACRITESIIAEAVIALPQIAQQEGIVTESGVASDRLAPTELAVERRKGEKGEPREPPAFGAATSVRAASGTAEAARAAVSGAEARGEAIREEARGAGARKNAGARRNADVGNAEAGLITRAGENAEARGQAPTRTGDAAIKRALSPEEERVYARAIEEIRKAVEEQVAKAGEQRRVRKRQ